MSCALLCIRVKDVGAAYRNRLAEELLQIRDDITEILCIRGSMDGTLGFCEASIDDDPGSNHLRWFLIKNVTKGDEVAYTLKGIIFKQLINDYTNAFNNPVEIIYLE